MLFSTIVVLFFVVILCAVLAQLPVPQPFLNILLVVIVLIALVWVMDRFGWINALG